MLLTFWKFTMADVVLFAFRYCSQFLVTLKDTRRYTIFLWQWGMLRCTAFSLATEWSFLLGAPAVVYRHCTLIPNGRQRQEASQSTIPQIHWPLQICSFFDIIADGTTWKEAAITGKLNTFWFSTHMVFTYALCFTCCWLKIFRSLLIIPSTTVGVWRFTQVIGITDFDSAIYSYDWTRFAHITVCWTLLD